MDNKEICRNLIEKGRLSMLCCFHGMLGQEQKWNAPLYNRFVHGVRDTAVSQGILTMEEANRMEGQADNKFNAEDFVIDEKELVKLPPDDETSIFSYKRHLAKAILNRFLCLLCGVAIGYLLPFCFR